MIRNSVSTSNLPMSDSVIPLMAKTLMSISSFLDYDPIDFWVDVTRPSESVPFPSSRGFCVEFAGAKQKTRGFFLTASLSPESGRTIKERVGYSHNSSEKKTVPKSIDRFPHFLSPPNRASLSSPKSIDFRAVDRCKGRQTCTSSAGERRQLPSKKACDKATSQLGRTKLQPLGFRRRKRNEQCRKTDGPEPTEKCGISAVAQIPGEGKQKIHCHKYCQ
jgi:hypothetical protein